MNETTEETTTNTRVKVNVSDIVIATTVVVVTVGTLRTVAGVVRVPLVKLTDKLNRKAEKLNNK